MDTPSLSQIVEALIFAADQPLKPGLIQGILRGEAGTGGGDEGQAPDGGPIIEVEEADLEAVLAELVEKYQDDRYPFEIRLIDKGYQFFSKRAFYPFLKRATLDKHQKRLSRAALETLSIVAYRQPITKSELEFIRGVNCDYAVQKLLDKKLVSIQGRADAPGRPLLYGTSPFFMQYFGINELTDLPKLKEFEALAEDHLDEFRQRQADKQQNQDGKAAEQAGEKPAEKDPASQGAVGEAATRGEEESGGEAVLGEGPGEEKAQPAQGEGAEEGDQTSR